MPRIDRIETAHGAEIALAVDRLGDHEGISAGRVLAWLGQFKDEDLALGCRVLREIRYFNTANIRAMTRQLVEMVYQDHPSIARNRIGFVPVGEPGSGSGTLARILRGRRIASPVLSMADLVEKASDDFDMIVFLDDFSGTGTTLVDWWQNVEMIVRPLRVSVVVGLLVLTERARPSIEAFADSAIASEEIGDEADVFKDESTFTETEQERLDYYCGMTGCSPEYRRGFLNSGLLLAFKHGCPNNSLPILWYDARGWRTLFFRRAI